MTQSVTRYTVLYDRHIPPYDRHIYIYIVPYDGHMYIAQHDRHIIVAPYDEHSLTCIMATVSYDKTLFKRCA